MSDEPPLNLFSGDQKDLDVPGFPAPPETLSLAEARGARKTAIRACFDRLEETGPDGFGEQPLQKLANALGTLSEAVIAIDPGVESAGLAETAKGLESFTIDEPELRNRQKFWEKVRGKQTPLNLMLDRLEDLAHSMPNLGDPQETRWKELGAAYSRAHALTTELGDNISAGRARMAKANADLKPAHDRTLEILPENRGNESETALLALRAARDKIERRVHALRGTHLRGKEILTSVRGLAATQFELRRQKKMLEARILPIWEQTVANVIRSTKTDGPKDEGTDIDNLLTANKKLADVFQKAAVAGQELAASYELASGAVNPSQSAKDR